MTPGILIQNLTPRQATFWGRSYPDYLRIGAEPTLKYGYPVRTGIRRKTVCQLAETHRRPDSSRPDRNRGLASSG